MVETSAGLRGVSIEWLNLKPKRTIAVPEENVIPQAMTISLVFYNNKISWSRSNDSFIISIEVYVSWSKMEPFCYKTKKKSPVKDAR